MADRNMPNTLANFRIANVVNASVPRDEVNARGLSVLDAATGASQNGTIPNECTVGLHSLVGGAAMK